ncbi:metal-dependent hydrolase [Kutzneria buriramensis]|uniref:LexA-binding, inner membrane-associated putative hydrolase n=1 Tax=Kutzneria buriramensis TaxID=1045776 RepID=A0A3E0GY88_9PSEU|nr:metal-dependent hydrolase [Kutzneria buriramensis]REH31080.1 LexA-binding, inner membrane-associated putative hydrolase [Kutzneria buriramensis]
MATGPTHATSGAAAWAAVCWLGAGAGHPLPVDQVVLGALVCAGGALLPDLDTGGSMAARTFGAPTRLLGRGLGAASAWIYRRTRGPRDGAREGGHRTFTHTAVFAVLVAAVTSESIILAGSVAAAVALLVSVGLALRGLLHRWASRSAVASVSAGAVVVTVVAWPVLSSQSWWWLGIPLGLGCLVHDVGDATTKTGVPLLWPLCLAPGQRWYPVALPRRWRMRTGGEFELKRVFPVVVLVTAGALEQAVVSAAPAVVPISAVVMELTTELRTVTHGLVPIPQPLSTGLVGCAGSTLPTRPSVRCWSAPPRPRRADSVAGPAAIVAEERDQAGTVPVVRRVRSCARDNSRVRSDTFEDVQSSR